jgi:uncharacterized membrane protein
MLSDNSEPIEPTVFSAVLRPHRSLRRAGFLILMLLYGAINFGCGVMFMAIGAWPIFGVLGASVLLLYWAFRVNYARAAAYEEVTVTPSALTINKVSHRGRKREYVMNPLWVRLEKATHPDYGVERVFLISRGRELTLGSFLGPDEKGQFAEALGQALTDVRRGITRTALP